MLCQGGVLPFRKYGILMRSRTLSEIVAVATFIWDVCLQTLFLYEVLSSMKVLVGIKEVSLDTPEHVLVLLY